MVEKGLIYRQHRPVHYSPSSQSALAEAELVYNDAHVSHSVYVSFPLDLSSTEVSQKLRDLVCGKKSVSLLVWTTTPWTLPSNLAVCVHPNFKYIKIHDQERDQNFIIHENLLTTLYKDPKKAKFKKIGEFQGSDMKGWRYVPLFEYFTERVCFR